jgi:hypothetical protein
MPLYHCESCHHEFEHGRVLRVKCDWCGADGYLIQQQTAFEKFLSSDWQKTVKELVDEFRKRTGRS